MSSPLRDVEVDKTTPPTLEMVIEWLIEIADVPAIDPDGNLEALDVDSLDLIELAAAMEDMYGISFDEGLLDQALQDETVRQVYDRVVGSMQLGG